MSALDGSAEAVAARIARALELGRLEPGGGRARGASHAPEDVLRRLRRVGELRRLALRLSSAPRNADSQR